MRQLDFQALVNGPGLVFCNSALEEITASGPQAKDSHTNYKKHGFYLRDHPLFLIIRVDIFVSYSERRHNNPSEMS